MKNVVKKLIMWITCIIISIIFSFIIANILNLIFSNKIDELFEFNIRSYFYYFAHVEEVRQIFLLCNLAFFCIFLYGIFKTFGLKNYYSNNYKVTDKISIPLPVGKNQFQNGSVWWLSKLNKNFGVNILSYNNQVVRNILENKLDDNIQKGIFNSGGIVVGKKDTYKLGFDKESKFSFIPKLIKQEKIYYIKENLHSLNIGATRSGKSRCIVLQTIMNNALSKNNESMIISDPKGELFHYTSDFLKKVGYKVLVLDFKTAEKSNKYNFLDPVIEAVREGNIALAESRASDIATTLVGESKTEKIWSDGEKSVIKTGIMAVVMENQDNPEYQNMTNVYHFIAEMCAEQEDKTMLIDTFLDSLPRNHPAITSFAAARIAPSRTRASFFTSALTTLSIFVDSYISSMTSSSEIKADDLAESKTVLFLILPDEKLTSYPLCSIFINQMYMKLVEIADSKGGRLPSRVNFILDEFGNFATIPNFAGFLTVGGGRKIRFNLFIQSISQLNEKYGDNVSQNILDNCYVWNYLKTNNDVTAEKISKRLGTYTISSWSESNSSSGGAVNHSKSMNLSQRALLTPAEVIMLERPYLLVMCSGKNPAITNSPDLSKWLFNKLLGLGDENFNDEFRKRVEEKRAIFKLEEVKLWDISLKTKKIKQIINEEINQNRIRINRN